MSKPILVWNRINQLKMMYNKTRKFLESEEESGPFIQPIINKIAGLIRQQLSSHTCKGNLLLADTVNILYCLLPYSFPMLFNKN